MHSAVIRYRRLSTASTLTAAVLALVASNASAAGLTVRELIDIALENNRDLQAVRYVAQQARARLVQAGLSPNPRLELTTANDRPFANNGEYSTGVGVSQQFSIAGRIARQKDVARVDVDLAQLEIKEAERKLAGEVMAARFGILGLDRQIELRDRLTVIDQKLVDVTHQRFRAAEVSELDSNAAELDLQRQRQERSLLQSDRATRYAQLNQLLGRGATEALNLDGTAPSLDIPDLRTQELTAIEHRSDLRQATLNAGRARAEQALGRAERWEDWSVKLGVDQSRLVLDNGPAQSANRSIGFNVSIPLPLFNRNQGRIAEAVAAEARADAQVTAVELSIRNEVASVYSEVERLRQVLATYEQHTLPVSERNVALAQKSYAQGLATIVEVVQAQRQQGDLNVGYLNAFDQYLQARARLYTATAAYPE